jgi:stage II sporulation protein D
VVIAAFVALALTVGVGSARAATVVVVTGRGWGHGVGMSQWGARGYARHGWRWQQILAHYYPGTQVSSTPNITVRVLLAASQPSVDVGCAAPMRVADATGRTIPLKAGTYHLDPVLRIRKHSLVGPLAFYCDAAPLEWDGRAYHGRLVISSGDGRLAVTNAVDLEDYVRGVIGDEMPHRWPPAALEGQAVAARSYALATMHSGRRFDLPADDRSQVYGGIGAETTSTLHAASQTEGRILTYGDRVATTYYFSTSGGRTADARDVWPKLGPVPYLRSVSDPYDSASPLHTWGPYVLPAAVFEQRLGVPRGQLEIVRGPSGRVTALDVGSVQLTGDEVERALHLRSTWFNLAELSLTSPQSSVTYGRSIGLATRVTGAPEAAVQELRGSHWVTLQHVRTNGRVAEKPRAYTIYRLSENGVRGPEVGIAVAPVVRAQPESSTLLVGSVLPRPSGSVTVSRLVRGAWRMVARPKLNAHGDFRTPLRIKPGHYRVNVAGDAQFASTSRIVRITSRVLDSLHH